MHCCDLCKKQIILRFTKLFLPGIIFESNLEIRSLLFFWQGDEEGGGAYNIGSLELEFKLPEITGAWERPFENVGSSRPEHLLASYTLLEG